MLSTAKAGRATEDNSRAARVAFDGISFKDCEVPLEFFPPRIDWGTRYLLGKDLLVVFGVGGERKI